MIQLDMSNIQLGNISQEKVKQIVSAVKNKRENLGFIDVEKFVDIEKIQNYKKNVWNDFETIVVLGIGGSALGTKALLESLYGKYYNENSAKNGKNIYVLDNIDADAISDTLEIIDLSRTLFCCISKSGNTIETLSEYIFFREHIQEISEDWEKHFCFIVGENCKIRTELEKSFEVFYIPENIGGRFSVFTAVGLVPLAFSGADISEFLEGIKESRETYLSDNIEKNTALELAFLQHYYYTQEHRNITVFFPYSSRMFQLGEWYKQLIGESIGKNRQGITLTSSLGVTDQHSQLQLYQDGPQDKFFIFLDIVESNTNYKIFQEGDISFQELLKIEKYGTMNSLSNEKHPVSNISLPKINEKNIAELLFMFMFQIAYLGELFKINAFDQPGVEKSKIITQQKLKQEFGDINLFKKAFHE